MRGLDHIVHAVRDLDAAAAFYERLGFAVGARNVHPWGTCNRIVQLPGFFIEIVSVADEAALDASSHDGSMGEMFGAIIRDRLGQSEGFAFLMLESTDAQKDAADFAARGIARSGALTFSRRGQSAEGTEVTVSFSLAFAGDSHASGFAVSQQHNPQAFWNPALQNHRNGAQSVAGVVMVADNPADHHIFLEAFTGVRAPRSTSLGLVASTPRGEAEIVEVAFYRDAYGVDAKADGEGLNLAGLRIAVSDLAATQALLTKSGIAAEARTAGLVVSPALAFGATVIFERS